MLRIVPSRFITYKFFNSLFLGVSVGAIFTIYAQLEPSVYSLGGIALAVGMLIVARFYHRILNAEWFYRISLLVEVVLLIVMIYFLIHPYTYATALIVYLGYQLTFVFGSYLVRAETLLLKDDETLTRLDTAKQTGYLIGMGISFVFYKILEHCKITDNQAKVYDLHYLLIGIEVLIIILLIRSFIRKQAQYIS
jgi:predicted MFS family arabinose efflux permease